MRTRAYALILTISYLLARKCSGIHLIDLPNPDEDQPQPINVPQRRLLPIYPTKRLYAPSRNRNRESQHWLILRSDKKEDGGFSEEEKDSNMKNKIATLVQQTVHDSERRVQSIGSLKEKNRDQAPYKIGFILSMIKKARDVLNELFNVAVKHRDQWRALEQLKIFELVVHTNVDTTNLVRQMVEIHIQHLNSSQSEPGRRKRVVLLK